MFKAWQAHARYARGPIIAALLVVAPALAKTAAAVPRDAIDLSQVAVYNSPADIASWPVTTSITALDMQRPGGLTFTFSARNTWPDYVPPGWDGPLQYTVWAVVRVNGQWYTSGFIQMWRDRASTGAPILSDFARNWVYDSRWGPMMGHQPVVGEQMGFFVSSGNARGVTTATSVRQRSNVVVVSLPANDTGVFTFPERGATATDFDGDGRADLAVYRPSAGTGFILHSASGTTSAYTGGLATDIPVTGDFDGDRQADAAAYRPTTGTWFILHSGTGQVVQTTWGVPGDIPVPADYDGDGKTDIAVYRPSTGIWYVIRSSTSTGISYFWGGSVGDVPVPHDYDGDGKTDIAVFRPSTGIWYVIRSSTSTGVSYYWGGAVGDIPVPGDYDGDGQTDLAIFRPSSGVWYVIRSSTWTGAAYGWGAGGDIPVQGDYDGDGQVDLAVFRPSTGTWWVLASHTWSVVTYNWGVAGDIPIPMRP